MANSSDKRRFQRVDIRVPLQYKELKSGAPLNRGTLTKNISEGGVRFNTDKFISLACRLVVELNIPNASKPIRAISKVAWIKKLPVGDDYEVGNQFLDMARDDKNRISEYIKSNIDIKD